ncbi:MAG: 2-oxo acid dehydrogenase subunit E2 [Abitibacteriaceae bacterium]|nr:2-oxo acid dehydrogenase subunit E2 [Abditibacteriaceae bacterium]
MATEFKLPTLGENVDSGTVVQLLVAVGDQVEEDQSVLELETGKSVTEVPSNVSGTVKQILVNAGETVKVGQAILSVEGGAAPGGPGASQEAAAGSAAQATAADAKAESNGVSAASTGAQSAPATSNGSASAGEIAQAVGQEQQGAKAEAAVGSSRPFIPPANDVAEPPATGTLPAGAASSPVPGPAASTNGSTPVSTATAVQQPTPVSHDPAPAAPSVRRLAREIGVDIHQVKGSGLGGRISEEDVKNLSKKLLTQAAAAPAATAGAIPSIALPDFSKWGQVERQPLSGVRRATADQMARSWATVPHVTQFDKADITELEELRKRYSKQAESAGGKLTVTAIILKILVGALRRFPQFNSSLDLAANELVLKKYYHIGVAVDTEHGLLVPIIRDVDKKNIIELSVELGQVAERARNRKIGLEDMLGGSLTVTNLGGIGGTSFTPIVNAPEVAILGVARASFEPVYKEGEFQPRLMLPLALSYDHRVIDGADGARFLRWVANALEQPFLMSLEG